MSRPRLVLPTPREVYRLHLDQVLAALLRHPLRLMAASYTTCAAGALYLRRHRPPWPVEIEGHDL